MDWQLYEWINRIGGLLRLLMSLGVGVVALVVAIRLTRQRICREAAWLLAVGWLASWSVSLLRTVAELLLMPNLGWGMVRWGIWALDLLDLCCFMAILVGLFMFRPAARRSP